MRKMPLPQASGMPWDITLNWVAPCPRTRQHCCRRGPETNNNKKIGWEDTLGHAQAAPTDRLEESITPEDELRSQCYRLLARFLSSPPSTADLQAAAALVGGDSDLGRAITSFARVCAGSDATAVAREYHDLFIGLSRGELIPYGSYYLTGFLHEKPLAKLRQDMAGLGLEREEGVAEPEDHIASLCEMMAGLIDGAFGRALPLEKQKAFFKTHIGSWAPVLFRDMEVAKASVVFATLGSVGRIFLEIEESAFAMV
jgi:TorA maturation chaperone TorD